VPDPTTPAVPTPTNQAGQRRPIVWSDLDAAISALDEHGGDVASLAFFAKVITLSAICPSAMKHL